MQFSPSFAFFIFRLFLKEGSAANDKKNKKKTPQLSITLVLKRFLLDSGFFLPNVLYNVSVY